MRLIVTLSEHDLATEQRETALSSQAEIYIIGGLLRRDCPEVAAALDVSQGTVYRAKRRYAEEGLDGVLQDRVQSNRYRKLDDKGEAHPVSSTGQALIALACSPAPDGHDHWTLHLLADRVVELGLVESLSYETVRLRLKKTSSSRGGSSSGASPR